MSGSGQPSQASGNATRVTIATWAPLAVTVIAFAAFFFAYFVAWQTNDQTTLTLMAGAAINMAGLGMAFWVSSTAGKRAADDRAADHLDRQTEALAASMPAPRQ